MGNNNNTSQDYVTARKYEEYQKAFENYELEYWSNKFRVSKEVLKQAIAKVGVSAVAVEQYIKNVITKKG
jgi:hypothetical protein